MDITEAVDMKDVANAVDTPTAVNTTNTLNIRSNSLNLKSILKNIIEWITQSAVSSQMLRINLYTSFLICSNIVLGQDQIEQQKVNATLDSSEE